MQRGLGCAHRHCAAPGCPTLTRSRPCLLGCRVVLAAEGAAAGGAKGGKKVSAAVRKMQEAIEAQRRAQEEAERLAEEQRLKVGGGIGAALLGWGCQGVPLGAALVCKAPLQAAGKPAVPAYCPTCAAKLVLSGIFLPAPQEEEEERLREEEEARKKEEAERK